MAWGTQTHSIFKTSGLGPALKTIKTLNTNRQFIIRPCARCGIDIHLRLGYYKKILASGWEVMHFACAQESKKEILASRLAIALRKIEIAKRLRTCKK